MLRFIISRRTKDRMSGLETTQIETFDIDVPDLQDILTAGGQGQDCYDIRELFAVEVRPQASGGEAA